MTAAFRHNLLSFHGLCTFFLMALLPLCVVLLGAQGVLADLSVRSAILIDAGSSRVLYAQDADKSIQPASLTKIASMYVALDAVDAGKVGLDDTVRVSRQAARQGGSRMFLKRGDRVSVDRLLYGMAISSGNDASMAVAETVAGSASQFVKQMNAKMRALGLKNTVFTNVHGLPSTKQRTTARDMARLAVAYLRAHPSALRYHKAVALRHNGVVTTNKNPLLRTYPGADGLKTGWVTASGYNIITTVRRDNTRLVAVILGAPDANTRAREVRRLMDAGFATKKSDLTVADLLKPGNRRFLAQGGNADDTKKISSSQSKKSKKERVKRSASKKKTQTTAQSRKKSVSKKSNTQRADATPPKKQGWSSGSLSAADS